MMRDAHWAILREPEGIGGEAISRTGQSADEDVGVWSNGFKGG
jgi:hypothetical protein